MAIYTHQNVDLDAVASIWAARRFMVEYESKVKFVSADFDGAGTDSSDIIVCLDANGKGVVGNKEADDYVCSAFSKIIQSFAPAEEIEALKGIILYIDLQNNHDSATKILAVGLEDQQALEILESISLNELFKAAKSILVDDEKVTDYMSVIFEGFLMNGLEAIKKPKKSILGLEELYLGLQEAGVIPKRSPVTLPKKS